VEGTAQQIVQNYLILLKMDSILEEAVAEVIAMKMMKNYFFTALA
jgi:hypothetical protein